MNRKLLLPILLLLSNLARSEDSATQQAPFAAKAKADIQQVLAGPDFGGTRTEMVWRLKHFWNSDEPRETNRPQIPDFKVSPAVVLFMRLSVWLFIGLVMVMAMRHWRKWRSLLLQAIGHSRAGAHVAVIHERPQSDRGKSRLPPDVADAAEAAWRQGDARAALSLLYRGALAYVGRQQTVTLPDSATEYEVLNKVRATQPASTSDGLNQIVRAWLALAYASQLPGNWPQLVLIYRQQFSERAHEGS